MDKSWVPLVNRLSQMPIRLALPQHRVEPMEPHRHMIMILTAVQKEVHRVRILPKVWNRLSVEAGVRTALRGTVAHMQTRAPFLKTLPTGATLMSDV